jgi:hypothetical protein
MRLTRHSADAAILSAILFPFLSAAVGNLVCDQIRVDKISFDLSSLGGPHSVKHTFDLGDKKERNATYTIDLCQPLKKKKNKDDTDGTDCPNSSRSESTNLVVYWSLLNMFSLRRRQSRQQG